MRRGYDFGPSVWLIGAILVGLVVMGGGHPTLAQEIVVPAEPVVSQKPGGLEAGVEIMGEIAITASRTERRVFDTPQSVTVISREQIEASPFENVEDIVRQAAGIFNFRHFALHTNGINSPLKMRGVGPNRVLLLVDGVPQNDNQHGGGGDQARCLRLHPQAGH